MTGNTFLDLAISLGGVAFLVAVSWFLGAWRTASVSEAAAAERLAFDEPDFEAADWAVDARGRAAAAISSDGREQAVVFRLGDGLASRRAPTGAWPISMDGPELVIRLAEPSKRAARIAFADTENADAWARRLAENGAKTRL